MKKHLQDLFSKPKFLLFKILLLLAFLIIFTGSDLFVKYIVEKNLKDKSDIVVIKDFWHYRYVQNDDIGFSLLSSIEGVSKLRLFLILQVLGLLIALGFYLDIKTKDLSKILIISAIAELSVVVIFLLLIIFSLFYNSSDDNIKWIFLVFLQGSGTFLVFLIYLFTKKWKYIIPLALIISGALGNVFDRVIRGYVVDFVMWTFKFIPHPLFNPWPIFNLADVYTVSGAVLLFIILLFFSKDELKEDVKLNDELTGIGAVTYNDYIESKISHEQIKEESNNLEEKENSTKKSRVKKKSDDNDLNNDIIDIQ
ncbi:MAG: signal peptidase II [Spirochaetes bacterium]|nr:signal peptidase II [Spirochaetota bacterium]